MNDVTRLKLTSYDPGYYTGRGLIHDLEYYDGSLLSAQVCVAEGNTPMVELGVDTRMAETDGDTVYFRVSKRDLLAMLQVIEEQPVGVVKRCDPGCPSCYPSPHAERDE